MARVWAMRMRGVRLGVVVTLALLAGCATAEGQDPQAGGVTTGSSPTDTPTLSQSVSPTIGTPSATADAPVTPTESPTKRKKSDAEEAQVADGGVPFAIKKHPIPFGPERRAQMVEYAKNHYGVESADLDPSVIVLHFTEGDTWQSAFAVFSRNSPARGEAPGTCAHYVVDQKGVVLELVPPDTMCRHAVGLNHKAIGIEIVQNSKGKGSRWAEQQILARDAQITNSLALVRHLQATYGISKANVIGHATANSHPAFLDNKGWKNDHTDWGAKSVEEFKARL